MMKSGANKVILGCTEIPLVAPKGPNIIDAGEVVIKKMLDIAGI
jgi:aspartate/glutamate racemase